MNEPPIARPHGFFAPLMKLLFGELPSMFARPIVSAVPPLQFAQ
jgi:hypothetical protein